MARPPGSSARPVSRDFRPRISCRYSGSRITAPNSAIMATTSSSTETVNIRKLKARRSSRGPSDFCSLSWRSTNASQASDANGQRHHGGGAGRLPPWPPPIWLRP